MVASAPVVSVVVVVLGRSRFACVAERKVLPSAQSTQPFKISAALLSRAALPKSRSSVCISAMPAASR